MEVRVFGEKDQEPGREDRKLPMQVQSVMATVYTKKAQR